MKININHYVMIVFGLAVIAFIAYDSVSKRGEATIMSNLLIGERTICFNRKTFSIDANSQDLTPIIDKTTGNVKACTE